MKTQLEIEQLLVEFSKTGRFAAGALMSLLPSFSHAETPATIPTPAVAPATTPSSEYLDYIGRHEGKSNKTYQLKGEPYKTIGVGHYMVPSSRLLFKTLLGIDDKTYDLVYSGKLPLDDEQVATLFNYDVRERIKIARRLFPQFDSYPSYVRKALLSGVYRGDYNSKQKTVKLINAGDWDGASVEYLNRGDFRLPGVKPRLQENAGLMKQYADELRAEELRRQELAKKAK